MAIELTLVLLYHDARDIPTTEDVEDALECVEIRREEEEV